MNEYSLSEEFCKQHFLVGLLLQEVRTSLNEVFQIRKVAVSTLRDLLAKHELDDRYQNKVILSFYLEHSLTQKFFFYTPQKVVKEYNHNYV